MPNNALISMVAVGLLLAFNLVTPTCSAQDPIFLPLVERGAGAPTKANLKKTVILTDISSANAWYAPIQVLKKAGYREVISIRPWNAKKAFAALKRSGPGAVICVFRPKTIDVNFHFDFLERAARLDKDPFVDFHFGYITGATPKEAAAFAASACAGRKKKIAKSILEFGPSSRPAEVTAPIDHKWAKNFKSRRWAHAENATDVVEKLAKLKPKGILSAWGHGMPDGVDHGMKGIELTAQKKLDLSSCLYFSGPCYCGVPSGWFKLNQGKIERTEVKPEASFILGLMRVGIIAAFAGLDPDRGETNHHEREHVLMGESLGAASKATYDDVVIALGKPELKLLRYKVGERRPHKNVRETMISGGACRTLFGLPDSKPFKQSGDSPFRVKPLMTKKGLVIDWTTKEGIGPYWLPVDVFNGEGGWTHRLRFRCEIPIKQAQKLKSLKVIRVTKDDQDLTYINPTAAIELFGGKAYLHLTIAFPRNEKDRALIGGKKYHARFILKT